MHRCTSDLLSLRRNLPRQRFAVGFEESLCLWQQGFRGSFHHFTIEALNNGQAVAVVFDDDAGEGAVHGKEGTQR